MFCKMVSCALHDYIPSRRTVWLFGVLFGLLAPAGIVVAEARVIVNVETPRQDEEYGLRYTGKVGQGAIAIQVRLEVENIEYAQMISNDDNIRICGIVTDDECAEKIGHGGVCVRPNAESFEIDGVSPGARLLSVQVFNQSMLVGDAGCISFSAKAPSLREIGSKVSSDKVYHHGYDRFYEGVLSKYREKDRVKLLEIGLLGGGSIEMWRAYLPKSQFVGIDYGDGSRLSENCTPCMLDHDVRAYYGDQSNVSFLRQVIEAEKSFDIVIDDGGHSQNQQLTSFRELFPFVEPGGLYIIEDVETSYWEFDGDLRRGGKDIPHTPVNLFKRMVDVLNTEFHDPNHCYSADPTDMQLGGRDVEATVKSITFAQNWIGIWKKTDMEIRAFDGRNYRFKHRWPHDGQRELDRERIAFDVCMQRSNSFPLDDKDALVLYEELCKLQTSCKKRVQHTWLGNGLGAALHFLAISMTFAHASNRTLVPGDVLGSSSDISPYFHGSFHSHSCESKTRSGMNCFLRPISSCYGGETSLKDPSKLRKIDLLRIIDDEASYEHQDEELVFDVVAYEDAQRRYAAIHKLSSWRLQWWVPQRFRHRGPLWYKSHILNFVLQPNPMLAKEIAKLKQALNFDPSRSCLAMHVRRGDKLRDVGMSRENGFPSLQEYIEAAKDIREIHDPDLQTIFISTEDQSVIDDVEFSMKSGRSFGFKFVYTTDHKRHKPGIEESIANLAKSGAGINDGFTESMIAWRNLFLAAECNYFVGTLSSNWGRLVLELIYARLGHTPVYRSLDHDWIA